MPAQLKVHSRASVKSTCLILPFARLLLAVCCASGSLVAAQSTSPPGNVATRCESVILYEVCGDPKLLRQSATTNDTPVFDIGQAEELEIARQLRSLSAMPAASLSLADEADRKKLERRWNELVGPAIQRTSVSGGVAYFEFTPEAGDSSEGDLRINVLMYPPSLAVTSRRELVEWFNPSTYLGGIGSLIFATEPVARIDISRPLAAIYFGPATISVRWQPLERICKTMVDMPPGMGLDECARALIGFLEFPFQNPNLIGDTEKLSAHSPSLLEILMKYYVRIWELSVSISEFKKHCLVVPRRVFVFAAKGTASPSVDQFGNLYLPENLLHVWPNDAEKIDLVMRHEAAHLELLGAEFSYNAVLLFINELAKFALKNEKKDVKDAAAHAIPSMFRLFRHSDESLADLLALRDIGSDRKARKRYQALVEELETISVTRNDLLKAVCEYLDGGGDVDRLLAARAVVSEATYFINKPERGRAILSKYDSTKEWAVATRFADADLQNLERNMTELPSDIAPNDPELQNPWAFERQVQDMYEQILKQLRSKMPD